jgi:serine/threonine-protein kinase
VDDLFAALPDPVQRQVRELPALARRLEDDAQGMRRRVEELDAALAEASRDAGGAAGAPHAASPAGERLRALAATRRALVDDLKVARDQASERLALSVAALENIRLDLLRLRAGAGSVASLTATLDAARRAGEEIDAMVQVQKELEPARTPV